MTAQPLDIDAVARYLREFAEERDWVQYHTPKNLAMALAAEAGEPSDEGHVGPEVQHLERPRERFPSPDLQDVLDTDSSGDLQHLLLPLGIPAIVYRSDRSELNRPGQFLVAGRGDDGSGPRRGREEKAEARDASGASRST